MFTNKHIVLCIVLFFSVSIKAQESVVKIPKKAALYSAIIPGVGQVYTKKYWKIPINTPLRQKLALMTCAGRGPSMGGNTEAREASFKFSAEFFTNYLKE